MCFSAGRAFDSSCRAGRRRGRSTNMSRGWSAVGRGCSRGTKIWFADLEISFIYCNTWGMRHGRWVERKRSERGENCFVIRACSRKAKTKRGENWHWPSANFQLSLRPFCLSDLYLCSRRLPSLATKKLTMRSTKLVVSISAITCLHRIFSVQPQNVTRREFFNRSRYVCLFTFLQCTNSRPGVEFEMILRLYTKETEKKKRKTG